MRAAPRREDRSTERDQGGHRLSNDPQDTARVIAWRGLMVARAVLVVLALISFSWLGALDSNALAELGWLPRTLQVSLGFAVIAGWVGASVVQLAWARRRGVSELSQGFHLAVDVLALTALLMATGGARNPFTLLYFVPLTLATQVSARATWTVAALTSAGFACMFVVPGLGPPASGPHAHHFAGHMRGMWYAFAAAGALVTFFVQRIARGLDEQRQELAKLRDRAMQDRHLAAIGALAAGAAHELGTPLGSISLLSEELPLLRDEEHREALAQMRVEIQRAKAILHRMRAPAPTVSALEAQDPWPLGELEDLHEGAAEPAQLTWNFEADCASSEGSMQRQVVAQILRELLRNAGHASAAAAQNGIPPRVEVCVRLRPASTLAPLEIEVRDSGPGMDPQRLEAAFKPLATTRSEGMGLGLFLARGHARTLGGELHIESEAGVGTRAYLRLPWPSANAEMGQRA